MGILYGIFCGYARVIGQGDEYSVDAGAQLVTGEPHSVGHEPQERPRAPQPRDSEANDAEPGIHRR
eukprot:308007-Prorocentrum_minimum.AAC.2